MKKYVAAIAALAVSLLVAPGGVAVARDAHGDEAGIRAVQAWTEKYHSEEAAIADGFVPTDECVPAMGYHYVNFARLDDKLEPNRPEALLYAPTADGGRVLAGAEWLVVDEDQDLATDNDRPQVFGHPFDGPMPGHVEGMPVHYDLHAYAWVPNPDGSFATWNNDIDCPEE